MPARRRRQAAQPAEGVEEAAALLAAAERPSMMAGTGLYWGRGEERAARAGRGARDPGLPQRPRPRLPARRPRARLQPRPRRRAQGRRRGARRSACRSTSASASARASARRRRSSGSTSAPNALTANRLPDVDLVGDVAASLAAIREAAGGEPGAHAGLGASSCAQVEEEKRAAEREELERPALAAAPGPRLQGAGRGARPRRDRRRRRRRLRLLRRALHRHLRAGLLDGPGAVRLPRRRARAGDRRQARPSRAPGLPAARRRRLRLRRDGVRHDGAPRPAASSA